MAMKRHHLARTYMTMFDFLELNCSLLTVSNKNGKHSVICLEEQQSLPEVKKAQRALKGEFRRGFT